ncbi:heat shock protein beta-11-like [Acipenser oxyrinchus oxyrinchus]|uniref:Heat shock protein n=1 Tax=Acipenser oxyrinchus oxyrinchus TaxID=40147 RepID=A0A3G2LMV4_ACIOX|nr:heat shock protein [Acipenser oxyrinchus oxyrinchus]KAK1175104.1 heat shock protein beta-11-like [Acipenser oxyrinchus oxyrinchus]
MLCSPVFQPSLSIPFAFNMPVRSLWPENRPIFIQMENESLRQMEELKRRVEFIDQVHQVLLKEVMNTDSATELSDSKSPSYKLEKDGNCFCLMLDTKDFLPEELTVKQVGRKLLVSGKHEKKDEARNGSYSYKYQEFRQELELPEDVKPDAVTCSFSNGQLQIEVPSLALPAVTERTVPINTSPAMKTQQERSAEEQE